MSSLFYYTATVRGIAGVGSKGTQAKTLKGHTSMFREDRNECSCSIWLRVYYT